MQAPTDAHSDRPHVSGGRLSASSAQAQTHADPVRLVFTSGARWVAAGVLIPGALLQVSSSCSGTRAAWRSPYVPCIRVVFLLAFAVLDFALGQGVASHLVNLVGFAIVAGAVVTGYTRKPWERVPAPESSGAPAR